MHKLLLVAIAALNLFLANPGLAVAADSHAGQRAQPGAAGAAAQMPLSDGLVKKVDLAKARVTVAHGPLPNGMPAMTMPMKVRDAAWLGKLQAGQNIRFAAEEVDGTLTIMRLELPAN